MYARIGGSLLVLVLGLPCRPAWGQAQPSPEVQAEALAATKRAFLAGDYGERHEDPRFWGAFVPYGRTAR